MIRYNAVFVPMQVCSGNFSFDRTPSGDGFRTFANRKVRKKRSLRDLVMKVTGNKP